MAWMAVALRGDDKNRDSFCAAVRLTSARMLDITDLASRQYSAHFPCNRFVAAEVGGALEDEAHIIKEVVPRVVFLVQPDGEA